MMTLKELASQRWIFLGVGYFGRGVIDQFVPWTDSPWQRWYPRIVLVICLVLMFGAIRRGRKLLGGIAA